MPIFEYRCSACDHLEEVLQKHSDPAPATCPECGKAGTLTKEISATSFQLKGGGWYKDLYASSSKSDAKKESKDSKSESKGESKTETKKADTSSSGSSGSSGGSSSSSGGSSGGSSASSSAAA